MRKRATMVSIGAIVVLAGLFSLISIISGDEIANKQTKIQLVDSNGKAFEQEVPLSLVISAQLKECKMSSKSFTSILNSIFGRKSSSNKKVYLCKSIPFSFSKTVLTDGKGGYTVSTDEITKTTSQDQIAKIANTAVFSQLPDSQPLSDSERQTIAQIINSQLSVNNEQTEVSNIEQAEKIIKASFFGNQNNQAVVKASELNDVKKIISSHSDPNAMIVTKDYGLRELVELIEVIGSNSGFNLFRKFELSVSNITVIQADLYSDLTLDDKPNIQFTESSYREKVEIPVYQTDLSEAYSLQKYANKYIASLGLTDKTKEEDYKKMLNDFIGYLASTAADDSVSK